LPPFTYEDLLGGVELVERRRGPVDRPPLALVDGATLVDDVAEHVEDAPQRALAHGHRDRPAGVHHGGAACQAVGGVERHRAHAVVAQVLLHLGHQGRLAVAARDLDRVVDGRQPVGEAGVDHHSLDLEDGPRASSVVSHVSRSLLGNESSYSSASAPPTTSRISWVIAA